ncbi:MAG: hypothetical protein AAF550_04160 [Myxococcota bacterium]
MTVDITRPHDPIPLSGVSALRSCVRPEALYITAVIFLCSIANGGSVHSAVAQSPVAKPDGTDRAGETVQTDAVDRVEGNLPKERLPTVEVTLKPRAGWLLGEVATLSITAEISETDEVAVPAETTLDPFFILDRRSRVIPSAPGKHRYEFSIELLAEEPGAHEIPSIKLRIVTGDNLIGLVRTEPIAVRIESVLGNEPNAEPKPPTGPVVVMQRDLTLVWVGVFALVIAITAICSIFLFRWWQRRPKKEAPPPPRRPPWDIALERLHALEQQRETMFSGGRAVEWVDGVSDALRQCLGVRYGFDGLESTTDEVVGQLRSRRSPGVGVEHIELLLSECDLIKFASAAVDMEEGKRLFESAREIVEHTRVDGSAEQPVVQSELDLGAASQSSPLETPDSKHRPLGEDA